MRSACMAALWILVGASGLQSAHAQAPAAKPAEHPLDQTPAKTSRTHRDAGHLDLLEAANWQIRGCNTFTPDQIRGSIARDEDVLLATHPAAPADDLDKLPELLAEKVLDGYLTNGFPQPQVHARRQGDQIEIDIVEGPRYNAGEIEITGTKTLDVNRLLARLSEPYIPESAVPAAFESDASGNVEIVWTRGGTSLQRLKPPAWEIGKPAWLGVQGTKFMRRQMEHACTHQGRPDAKFEMEIRTEPGRDAARLVVRVTDEGPPLVIKRVSVEGCKRNTPQQIIDYLQVKTGSVWTRDAQLQVKRRLWQAARFRSYELDTQRQASSAEATLVVKVTESESAPLLSRSFTPIEQAFLKFRDWVGALPHADCDLVFNGKLDGAQFDAIISPKLGGMLNYRPADVDDEPAPGHWAVMSADALGLYSQATGRRLLARPLPGCLQLTCEFELLKKDDGEEGKFVLGVGANTWSSAPAGPPALRCLFLAPPVAFVTLAQRYGDTCQLTDGVLTFRIVEEDDEAVTHVRVLAATGELLELTYHDGDSEGRVSVVENAFRDRARALEAEFGKQPNEFNASQPLGSTLDFLVRDADDSRLMPAEDQAVQTAIKLARKALAGHILEPLDHSLMRIEAAMRDPNLPFWLGSNPKQPRKCTTQNAESVYTIWLYSDSWAAPRSWLWDLVREAVLIGVGLDQYSPMEIAQQLTRPSNGPLANLAAAAIMQDAGAKLAAFRFARRGRQALESAKFRADVVALLDDRGLVGRCLLRAGEIFRNFDQHELALLTGGDMQDADAVLLRTVWHELRKDPQRPIAQALPDALDQLWESQIKARLTANLRDYPHPPKVYSSPAPAPSPALASPPADMPKPAAVRR